MKSHESTRNLVPSGSATFALAAARLEGDRVRFHRPIAPFWQLPCPISSWLVSPECVGKWCPKLIHTLRQTYKKLLKMAIEIVDLPIKNGDFPLLYVSLPEGFTQKKLDWQLAPSLHLRRWDAENCPETIDTRPGELTFCYGKIHHF